MKPVVSVISFEAAGASLMTRLAGAGFTVRAYCRTAIDTEEFGRVGVTIATTPRQAAEGADVIVVLARDALALSAVLDTSDGVLAGSRTGSLIINMGAFGVESSRATETLVNSLGLRYVEAVLWGDTSGIEKAPTAIMIGGTAEDAASAISLLCAISPNVTHVGPAGQAISTKAAVDCLLQCACAVVVDECIGAGMDPAVLAGLAPEVASLARRGHETLESITRPFLRGGALPDRLRREARPDHQEMLEVARREISKRIGLDSA